MKNNVETYCPAPQAIERGIMTIIDGEPYITPAGMFSILGLGLSGEPIFNNKERLRFANTFNYILDMAQSAGLESEICINIKRWFTEGVNPVGNDEHSEQLALYCQQVAQLVGPERMLGIINGIN
jgi:hypothetical protein